MSGRKNTEATIQRELVKWLHINYPQIEIIYRKNEGKKSKVTAILDKLMGLAAGVPDLQLLVNINDITYLLELELKTKTTDLNPNQKKWHAKFISTTNRKVAIAYGYIEAQQAIHNWLSTLPKNN